MTDVNRVLICAAADQAAAEALASTFPGGSGTFSVRVAYVSAPAVVAFYAGSGFVSEEMAAAFDASVDPMFKVFDLEGTDFYAVLAACDPPLQRVVDEL